MDVKITVSESSEALKEHVLLLSEFQSILSVSAIKVNSAARSRQNKPRD